MNTKIIIAATVAAFSLATTAFAGESSDAYAVSSNRGMAATLVADVGSEQYPTPNPRLGLTALNNASLPENGQNGSVESVNSVPTGAMVGTGAYRYAQSVNLYFAQQADRRFAQAHRGLPNS